MQIRKLIGKVALVTGVRISSPKIASTVALLPRLSALREPRSYRQGKIPISAALT